MEKTFTPKLQSIPALAAGIAIALSLTVPLPAATLYWGGGAADITPPQAPTPVDGTWNDTIQNWASDVGGTAYQAWTPGSIADFGTNTGTGPTVTVDTDLNVGGITYSQINNGELILTNNTIDRTILSPAPTR